MPNPYPSFIFILIFRRKALAVCHLHLHKHTKTAFVSRSFSPLAVFDRSMDLSHPRLSIPRNPLLKPITLTLFSTTSFYRLDCRPLSHVLVTSNVKTLPTSVSFPLLKTRSINLERRLLNHPSVDSIPTISANPVS